ncbi:MAG: peptidylprolyl isomerase [Rubrobacteraceae bacterium]|nr:peptidylprolyl isomerase [Rubrobacter sp.]
MSKAFVNKGVVLCGLVMASLVFAGCNAADPVANNPSGAEKVATFEGGEVTQGEVQEQLDLISEQQGGGEIEAGSPQYEQAVAQIMPQLVQTEIIGAYVEENDIEVTEQEVDEELDFAREQAAASAQEQGLDVPEGEAFDLLLEQSGLTEEDLRNDIRELILPGQKVQERVVEDAEPSDEEVQTYYEENEETQYTTPPQRCADHILFGPDQEEQAEETLQELEDGGDFAELATELSQDTGSAENGGELGCIGEGETVPNFEEALFDAEEGETVGPVETQFGFHIIRVNEVNEESAQPFEEVEGEIREQLTIQAESEQFSEWLAGQEEERNVEYREGYDPAAAQEQMMPEGVQPPPEGEAPEGGNGGGEGE